MLAVDSLGQGKPWRRSRCDDNLSMNAEELRLFNERCKLVEVTSLNAKYVFLYICASTWETSKYSHHLENQTENGIDRSTSSGATGCLHDENEILKV